MDTATDPPTTRVVAPGDDGGDHVDHLLDQWAERRPELDTSTLRIAARVVRLARYLDRDATEHLAPLGLNEGEVNVLAALRRAGPPHELTPTELYRSLLVSSGAMTNRLDRLEAAGLLVRTPDPDDRRRVRVGLTEEGVELIDAAIDAHVEGLGRLFADLERRDADALTGLLRTVLRQLEARDPDA
jgi:DNA-binding MarR family transcriptional regulator